MLHYSIAGQIAGASSTEFGLANMIWAAVVVAKVSFPALVIGAPMYTDGILNVRGDSVFKWLAYNAGRTGTFTGGVCWSRVEPCAVVELIIAQFSIAS